MSGVWRGALHAAAGHALRYGFDDAVPRTTRVANSDSHRRGVLTALAAAARQRDDAWRPSAPVVRRRLGLPSDATFFLTPVDSIMYTAAALVVAAAAPLLPTLSRVARPRHTLLELAGMRDPFALSESELERAALLFTPNFGLLAVARELEACRARGAAYVEVLAFESSVQRGRLLRALDELCTEHSDGVVFALDVLGRLFHAWDEAGVAGLPVHYVATTMLGEHELARVDRAAVLIGRQAGVRWRRYATRLVALSDVGCDGAREAARALARECTGLTFSAAKVYGVSEGGALVASFGVPVSAIVPAFAVDVCECAEATPPCVTVHAVADYRVARAAGRADAFDEHMARHWVREFELLLTPQRPLALASALVPLLVDWVHATGRTPPEVSPSPEQKAAVRAVCLCVRNVLAAVRAHPSLVTMLRYLLDVLPGEALDRWRFWAGRADDELASLLGAAVSNAISMRSRDVA